MPGFTHRSYWYSNPATVGEIRKDRFSKAGGGTGIAAQAVMSRVRIGITSFIWSALAEMDL
jgi:hypothetical protein